MAETNLFEAINEGQRRLDAAVAEGILSPGEAMKRTDYLERMAENYAHSARLQCPTVFISYAGTAGEEIYKKAYAAVRKTPACRFGPAFRVETGMRQHGLPQVFHHIRMHMRPCCVFLGIMTTDAALATPGDEGSHAPGAWVLIEAGMAAALGIPSVLLVEDTVHESFWKDQLGVWRHVRFTHVTLDGDLANAMGRLREHYADACRTRP